MNNYTVMNILDLLESVGTDEVVNGISDFSCPQNQEIEDFLHKNAIEFARRKLSITYLLLDNLDGEIVGYFTLTHKAIEVKNDNISNTVRRIFTKGIWAAILYLLCFGAGQPPAPR